MSEKSCQCQAGLPRACRLAGVAPNEENDKVKDYWLIPCCVWWVCWGSAAVLSLNVRLPYLIFSLIRAISILFIASRIGNIGKPSPIADNMLVSESAELSASIVTTE